MQLKRSFDKRWIWIGLGLLTLLLRYTASAALVEKIYSRGLFLWIRRVIDYGLGWFPLPLIYVFFLVFLLWLISTIRKTSWRDFLKLNYLLQTSISLLAFLGGVLFFFFFLWGFNYGRIPLTEQVGLEMKPIPVAILQEALDKNTADIIRLRTSLSAKETPLDSSFLPENMEFLVRESVKASLQKLGYPTVGKVRGRLLVPKGIFLRFSSAGLYWPFVGEGNIDSGLHGLQQPFTLAHEIAHGYGITNEGVCNFIAYLACQESDNAFIQYSGKIAYWRYLAGAYQGFKKEEYRAFRKALPAAFQADLDVINQTLVQYPDILPKFRNFAYDTYLKSQGIEAGMESYSQIIMLVEAWRVKNIVKSEE